MILHTREHLDFHELPDQLQGELALRTSGFMARPVGIHQLQSGFAQIWDDILPPLPEDVWRENLEIVRRELATT